MCVHVCSEEELREERRGRGGGEDEGRRNRGSEWTEESMGYM